MIKTERHIGIILEALEDYRRWYADNPNDIDESDAEKLREIDNAIEFMKGT